MDPLSITASLVAILGVARSAIDYLDRIRQFSPTYTKLLEEVRSAELVLSNLERLSHDLKPDSTYQDCLQRLVSDGHLASFKSTVERLSSRLKRLLEQKHNGKALLWPFKETEIKEAIASIERYKTLCQLALAGDNSRMAQAMRSKVLDLEQGMQSIGNRIDHEQRKEVLQWLSSVQPSVKRQDVNDRHVSGTGQWFLEREELRKWAESQDSLPIWCRGPPGAGKTDLFSLLVSFLRERAVGSEIAITYFYCDYREAQLQTPLYIISTLLEQLAASRTDVPPPVQKCFDKFKKKSERPKLKDLADVFRQVVENCQGTYVLLDALDECEAHTRKTLLNVLKDLASGPAKIKILFTSRPHLDDITGIFDSVSQMEIKASREDIKTFVLHSIENHDTAKQIMHEDLKERIVTVLLDYSDGMYA